MTLKICEKSETFRRIKTEKMISFDLSNYAQCQPILFKHKHIHFPMLFEELKVKVKVLVEDTMVVVTSSRRARSAIRLAELLAIRWCDGIKATPVSCCLGFLLGWWHLAT